MEVDASEYANAHKETDVRTLERLHGKSPTNILIQDCHLSHGDEKLKYFSFLTSSPGKDKIFFCFAHRESLNTFQLVTRCLRLLSKRRDCVSAETRFICHLVGVETFGFTSSAK